jgi:hypothetical protein
MSGYTEALSSCIDALRKSATLEEALTRVPSRYHHRLRQELQTVQSLQRVAAGVAEPAKEGATSASMRFRRELAELRAAREARALSGRIWSPARVGAVAALVIAVLAFGLFFGFKADGPTVEAATVEGVVVESKSGAITLQTLDTLEQVTVPRGALISDVGGAAIDLGSIEPGQVVLVRGNRVAQGTVAARTVDRGAAGLQTWCVNQSDRCQQLELRLQETKQRCEGAARCLVAKERLAPLLERLGELAVLEDLGQKCREFPADCRDLVRFCRAHDGICGGSALPAPAGERPEEARERLRSLDERCRQGEVERCRQLGQACGSHPALCPEDLPARP